MWNSITGCNFHTVSWYRRLRDGLRLEVRECSTFAELCIMFCFLCCVCNIHIAMYFYTLSWKTLVFWRSRQNVLHYRTEYRRVNTSITEYKMENPCAFFKSELKKKRMWKCNQNIFHVKFSYITYGDIHWLQVKSVHYAVNVARKYISLYFVRSAWHRKKYSTPNLSS